MIAVLIDGTRCDIKAGTIPTGVGFTAVQLTLADLCTEELVEWFEDVVVPRMCSTTEH